MTIYIWKENNSGYTFSIWTQSYWSQFRNSRLLSEDSDEPIGGGWVLITTRKGIKQSATQNPCVEHHGSDMPIIYGQIIVVKKIMGKNIFKEREIWK